MARVNWRSLEYRLGEILKAWASGTMEADEALHRVNVSLAAYTERGYSVPVPTEPELLVDKLLGEWDLAEKGE